MTNYVKQWSSGNPGLIIITEDLSGSMLHPYVDGKNRTQFCSDAVNRLINDLISRNYDGKAPKDRCYVVVIGYGNDAKILTQGYLSELDKSPLSIENRKKKISDGAGGLVEIDSKMPVWVEPTTKDAVTNQMAAFLMAKEILEKWVQDKPDSPASVVINLSDGAPYTGGKGVRECMDETIEIASQIKSISTSDGPVLIFNAMIGDGAKAVFPDSPNGLGSEEANFLYETSSEIPEAYRAAAEKNGLPYKKGARGAIYNAAAEDIIKLVDFGSSKGLHDA